MKYFLDTEFIEDGKTIELISIGIVAEDDRQLYLISDEFSVDKAWSNEWVRDNVLKQIYEKEIVREDGRGFATFTKGLFCTAIYTGAFLTHSLPEIKLKVLNFIGEDSKPEFWGWYSDYDWVVLCQLFGAMINLPKHFPMYCRDLKQFVDARGITLSTKNENEHNALGDAIWLKKAYYEAIAFKNFPRDILTR